MSTVLKCWIKMYFLVYFVTKQDLLFFFAFQTMQWYRFKYQAICCWHNIEGPPPSSPPMFRKYIIGAFLVLIFARPPKTRDQGAGASDDDRQDGWGERSVKEEREPGSGQPRPRGWLWTCARETKVDRRGEGCWFIGWPTCPSDGDGCRTRQH